jgi:CheY-like chemotaxis protein
LLLELSPKAEISVIGDANRLRQVLINLLSNGVKFTHTGEVLLTVSRRSGSRNAPVVIEFSVSDTGIGIPASQLSTIFEDFAQADISTARRFGGTGLGLGICRRIVTMMGGQIDVESMPGEGSTFSFSLPFQQPASPTGVPPALKGQSAYVVRDEPQLCLNILIAEDNDKNQRLLEAYLAKAGHVWTMVEDGVAAVEKAEQEDFDLVLMDVRMPKMDGLTAIRKFGLRRTSEASRYAEEWRAEAQRASSSESQLGS